MEFSEKTKISSYGLIQVESFVDYSKSYEDVATAIIKAQKKGLKICPFGSSLSFSNVGLVSNQLALGLKNLNKILSLDIEKKEITVQGGVKVPEILKQILPLGFTLIGLTGSLGNTVAGNISSDTNGKDCWKNGNFGKNIISMKLMLANTEIVEVSPSEKADLFYAVTGGLGLLGVVLEIKLSLYPIPSGVLHTKSLKFNSVESLTELMFSLDSEKTDFAYCWTDPFAPQKNLGRGLLETAQFVENTSNKNLNFDKAFLQKEKIFGFSPSNFWSIARLFSSPLFFNLSSDLKYFISPKSKSRTVLFHEYQYPMIKYFPQWNLKFYPAGFRENQIFFPAQVFESAYKEVLFACRKHGLTPNICAVRKHIAQKAYLSFGGEGFSMTINYGLNDVSKKKRLLFEKEILEITLKYKGQFYLSKFPFIKSESISMMYPQFSKFIAIKKHYDPTNLFWSDAIDHWF
jgi:decaprenylphospho-beta-D-ribofuranose 2-oxidase